MIGSRENLQERLTFNENISGEDFPFNQSIENRNNMDSSL